MWNTNLATIGCRASIALAMVSSCSNSWENTPLFRASGKQLTVSTVESGNPKLSNHYFLNYSGAVGKRAISHVGILGLMPGKATGLDIVDLNGDGNEDVVLSFVNTTLNGTLEPRFHYLIQSRTATSLQLGEVLKLPQVPRGLIDADATSVDTDVSSGQLRLHVETGTEELWINYDHKLGSWSVQ